MAKSHLLGHLDLVWIKQAFSTGIALAFTELLKVTPCTEGSVKFRALPTPQERQIPHPASGNIFILATYVFPEERGN